MHVPFVPIDRAADVGDRDCRGIDADFVMIHASDLPVQKASAASHAVGGSCNKRPIGAANSCAAT